MPDRARGFIKNHTTKYTGSNKKKYIDYYLHLPNG